MFALGRASVGGAKFLEPWARSRRLPGASLARLPLLRPDPVDLDRFTIGGSE